MASELVNAPVSNLKPAIGNFDLLHEIAAGGMATVYLARKRGKGGLEPLVAIKCCHPHLKRDPAFVTMFLDEARLAARIHHPNVVSTLEVGDTEALYFVMQYIEGASLGEWLKRLLPNEQQLREPMVLRVLIDALLGLHAAHELRDEGGNPLHLVHRDVSPQNFLIGLDGVTRIADFGIAKAESRATRTRTGQVKGKTGYMSPEQLLSEPLDRRADVYAAGVVLWEALVGRRLFDGDSDAATINQVLNNAVPPPSTLSNVSRTLDAIVNRVLLFKPDARYATALEFAKVLEHSGLEIATHQQVGNAVDELFGDEIRRLRQASLPAAGAIGASTPEFCRPIRTNTSTSRQRWLALATMLVVLTFGTFLIVSLRHGQVPPPLPSLAQPAPTQIPVGSTVTPTQAPSATPSTLPPGASVETHSRKTTKAQTAAPTVLPVTPSSPQRAQGEGPSPAPAPASARPKAKPSEFRPPDL